MLITGAQLEKFSGVYRDSDDVATSLQTIYIKSAQQIIDDYVGYNCEEKYTEEVDGEDVLNIPEIFKLVCLEIASLLQMEESENLGVNNKSFSGTGTRTFLNVVDYTKYLQRLSAYRVVV